ncbi:MAG: type 2 lantipeptide synthetase LanM [Gemmataceae bacterium]|nr:type 2 lantipeptide synthetase LanM [Gemmataceae bacterium]
MQAERFESAAWSRAATLAERVAASRPAAAASSNGDRADQRLREWRAQPPFASGFSFDARLAALGLSEDEFLRLLGEPDEALRARFPEAPKWLLELASAYESSTDLEPEAAELYELLAVAEPLILAARERLRAGIDGLPRDAAGVLPFDPDAVERLLLAMLPDRLLPLLGRTLVLEMHIARLQGLLAGETPEDRFRGFAHYLGRRDVAVALLEEYPVLARQLVQTVNDWVTFSLEFLGHLCADAAQLRATFGAAEALVAIKGDAGDRHRGGRAVLVADFASGLRLVYKPKSQAVEVHFQELLDWLNAKGAEPAFRTLNVLDCGDHGWVEFIQASGCESPGEVRRFYERQGGYLALLYVLAATDIHFENLIAAGEHPMLVDLETLFHRPLHGATDPGSQDSVLAVRMLPQRASFGDSTEVIDFTGLGGTAGQVLPYAAAQWQGAGTDDMRMTHGRVEVSGADNRPTLQGADVNLGDYEEELTAGFIAVYRLLETHREELLADDGPLARFAGDPVRFLARTTQAYSVLLQQGCHPDYLRDAIDRDRLFDRLWVRVHETPSHAPLIGAELAELSRGDVPMFTTWPDSCDVYSGSGEYIANVFPECGLDLVCRRICRLGHADLARQTELIHASFGTLSASGTLALAGADR